MVVFVGSVLGGLLGLAHAAYVYRVVAHGVPMGAKPDYTSGIYFAFWTFVLWAIFGSYVLILWLASVVFYIIFKAFRRWT